MSEKVILAISLFSLIPSLLILLSSSFPERISPYSHHKLNYLIYPLFFCQFMTAIGGLMGYPENEEILCKIQAFIISYFQLCSLFWSFIFTILLYRIIYCLPGFNPFVLPMYLICWGTPFVLTLLPLTTLSYGHSYDQNSFCFLHNPSSSSSGNLKLWSWFSYYLFYWCYLFINILLFLIILYKLSTVYHLLQSRFLNFTIITRCLLRLVAYPLVSIVTQFPSAIYYTMTPNQENQTNLQVASSILLMFGGFLTSLAFLMTHPSVNTFWASSSEVESSQNNTDDSHQKSSSYSNRVTAASIRHTRGEDGPVNGPHRRSTLFEVDEEYIFQGLLSINPEMRKRLSIDDLKILETLRMTSTAFGIQSSLSPHASRRYQDSDIDVSVSYRANSLESNDQDSLTDNRISLRLKLLKSTIHQYDDDRIESVTPFHDPDPPSQTSHDLHTPPDDRLSLCSLSN